MARSIESILKSFIHHVVGLQNEDDPAGTGFHREFRILREAQIENKNEDRFSMEDGKREENIKKNRYKDILPRDDRRVRLEEIPGEAGSDYINASYIDDVDGRKGYIAAQGPMPHTVTDFWRMLWQSKAEIVFMACRIKEDSRAKCEKYWPENGESIMYGDVKVQTMSEEEIQEHFIKRQLRAEKKGASHKLIQFQYVGWPDHNVPSSPDALRRMIEDVRNQRRRTDIPMVVHCSAGCGRTGTICAIDFAWTLLDKGMVTESFSMFEIIKKLREQRISMVQTPDQYEYTHMVMKSLCNEWLTAFAKHDYENVTLGGRDSPESYYNIEFPADGNSAKGAISSSNDAKNSSWNSKPPPNKKPELRTQKPDLTRSKPEIHTQKPVLPQQKPQGLSKPLSDPSSTAKSDVSNNGRQTVSHWHSSASTPPPLQDKKTGRNGVQGPVFLPEGSAGPNVLKPGSVGRAAIKQKSRPAMLQASQGEESQEESLVYGVIDRSGRKNAPQVPVPDYVNEQFGDNSSEAAPELPSRLYRPEEVLTAMESSKPPTPTSRPLQPWHNYNNIKPSIPPKSTDPPAPKGNVHRMVQPMPTNPPPSRSAAQLPRPIHNQVPSPRNGRAQGQGQAVGDSSSAADTGKPSSARVSRPTAQPRAGWGDSTPGVKRDFPSVFSGGSATTPQQASSGGTQKFAVAAPGPGQSIEAKAGTPFCFLERVPRVIGPRPPPAKWPPNPKSKATYL